MLQVAKRLGEKAQELGWKVYAVGGFVRDMVVGKESKDLDLEVFGPDSVQELIDFLAEFGEVNAVGKSFGVLKLRIDGVDLDVSLPRLESKQGKGHKGFVIKSDGKLTPKDACKRRDFTFNALLMFLPECKIVDLHNGQADLLNGRLHHTSEFFADDPLRVLRGMQFCGRFNLTAEKDTVELSRSLLPEFETLSKERLWIEFEKWATKSIKPSRGLVFLQRTGWLTKFPELQALVGCKQNPTYHAEGSVWQHIKRVCDQAAKIAIEKDLSTNDRLVLVLAALLHDVGKPSTTDDELRAIGHAKEGVDIAKSFLESINAPLWVIEKVCSMVGLHMSYVTTKSGVRKMSSKCKVPLSLQLDLMRTDNLGRISLDEDHFKEAFDIIDSIERMAKELDVIDDSPKPILFGRHLIKAGMKPGKRFGIILRMAFEDQLDGAFDDLDGAKKWLQDGMLI